VPVEAAVAERGEHVVQFYDDDAELVAAVAPYLGAALNGGEAAVVIASGAHRRMLQSGLAAAGVDVCAASADGSLLSLDAAATMRAFVADGQIDRAEFNDVVGSLIRRATASGRRVRAYGEMVALLWEEGNVLGAIDLEQAWNELATELTFDLFCAYPSASIAAAHQAEAFHHVCGLHSAVVLGPPESDALPATPSGELEVSARFSAERSAPGEARDLLRRALQEWGHVGKLVDDAALVVGELAANAVVHARSPFSVLIRMEPTALRLAVGDSHPSHGLADRGMLPEPTHGLALVDALAERWGVDEAPDSKIVWAELALRS
jgi:hypothetical protein